MRNSNHYANHEDEFTIMNYVHSRFASGFASFYFVFALYVPTSRTIMKNIITSFLIASAVLVLTSDLHAQFSFGLESSFAPKDSYAEVTLPATSLRTIIDDNLKGMDDRDVCLNLKPEGLMAGFQADFDGNDKEEMWLLYHAGPKDKGCNVMILVSPAGAGKFKLHDVMTLPAGDCKINPIITLDEGVQMYLENTYNLPDGTKETKGSLLAMEQTTMIILTSWTTKDYSVDGAMVYQDVRALFYDMNFDQTKELVLQFSKYSNSSKSEKALTDQYILTLDFLPENLRYTVYDSAGYDKIQEADGKARAGRRMLHKESTAMEGIAVIREGLDTNPFMTNTRIALGQYFLTSGRYGDAERMLILATDIDQNSSKGFMLLGDTYLRLNDLQKSLAAYQKYLAFNPKGRNARRVKKNVDRITRPR
jgi:hypothetical protein